MKAFARLSPIHSHVLSLGLGLAACSTVPGTGRKAFIAIPLDQEKQMGEQAYTEVLSKEKVSQDQRLTEMVRRVGHRLAAVVPDKGFDWQFTLVESKEMNAFCLPGGKVAIYTGILPVVQNEAGLAIVMGHEIAHAVARHGAERMTQTLAISGIASLTDAWTSGQYRLWLMAGMGLAQFGVILPYSRKHETEADSLGIQYAAQAGYDPAEGPRFWERFSKATSAGGKPPAILSTHPSDESRINNLEKRQEESRRLYEASPKYGLGEKI